MLNKDGGLCHAMRKRSYLGAISTESPASPVYGPQSVDFNPGHKRAHIVL
jgi:hypothetical protein